MKLVVAYFFFMLAIVYGLVNGLETEIDYIRFWGMLIIANIWGASA